MTESLRYLAAEDIDAIATYIQSVPPVQAADFSQIRAKSVASTPLKGIEAHDVGALVFAASCAGCHAWSGENTALELSGLIGSRTVDDPKATNLVNVVLHGGSGIPNENSAVMPAFGETYSDAEVAAVANFVTARFGGAESHVTAKDVARARSAD